jgi:glycosyltransferase involved in cell wall biosynthesis
MASHSPKLSVITPVYNGERYIGEAIESVLAQTCQDWELIVVDDGSTDATPSILQSFVDPRITYVRQRNQGPAAARNVGLERVVGQYVAFLDADDVYLPNAFADLAVYLDNHNQIDIVYSDGYICDADLKPLLRLSEIRSGFYGGNILEHVVLSSNIIAVPVCTMTRRCCIESNGIRFDEDERLRGSEDRDFWVQLACHAHFGYLDTLTCEYRVHDTNITRTRSRVRHKEAHLYFCQKTMNSNWFQDLSASTRRQFFHNLVVGFLSGDPNTQREILNSTPFLALPSLERAGVLRSVASNYLLHQEEPDFARHCLEQSLELCPADRKSWTLLLLLDLGLPLSSAAVYIWQAAHQAGKAIRSIGQRRPKRVPAALGPARD